MDVLAVRRNDGHLQSGNAHVEVRHRRAIDEPQPHALARPEESGPVAGGRHAVHQVCVGGPGHIGEVGRVHPHLAPRRPVRGCASQPLRSRIVQEVADRAQMAVVIVGLLLEFGIHVLGVFVCPIRQKHHMLPVIRERFRIAGLDDQRTVQPPLFLIARVAVVPVGARLSHAKAVREGLTGVNAVKAQSRHTVHVRREEDAVPVNRRLLAQRIGDAEGDGVAFLPTERRRRQRAIDCHSEARCPSEVHRRFADGQLEAGSG